MPRLDSALLQSTAAKVRGWAQRSAVRLRAANRDPAKFLALADVQKRAGKLHKPRPAVKLSNTQAAKPTVRARIAWTRSAGMPRAVEYLADGAARIFALDMYAAGYRTQGTQGSAPHLRALRWNREQRRAFVRAEQRKTRNDRVSNARRAAA